MARALKVFAGCFDGINRWVTAAHSHTAAIKIWKAHSRVGNAREYSAETGNTEEIIAAMTEPGAIWSRPVHGSGDFKKL